MKAFSVFDDFPQSSIDILSNRGISVDLLPHGQDRPSGQTLKMLLSEYDILFISTAQKMPEEMFFDITKRKIIGTASSGIDHIHIPVNKSHLIRIAKAGHANQVTVSEHTFGLILSLRKKLIEGRRIASEGLSKKAMSAPPNDLVGSTIGVIGAGGIADSVLNIAGCFGMKLLCWTFRPESHLDIREKGVCFVELDELLQKADVVSVNIPLSDQTRNLINSDRVALLKDNAVFVSTSRIEVTDKVALFEKAHRNSSFGLGMDVDASEVVSLWDSDMENVIITPHIGGGTQESRVRLFDECAKNVISLLRQ